MARLDGLTKTRSFFEGDFEDRRDELLDLKEDVLDPIRNFMSGSQATLYLQAKQFLKENEANFPYVDGDEATQLGQVLDDPKCYAGRGMQGVKTALDQLAGKIQTVLAQEQESAVEELEQDFQKLKGIQGFSQLSAEDQEMVDQEVQQSLNYARARQSIPVVREHRNRSYET
ncbi:MAG: hypothetical protein GY888_16870, partial [Planctomycetaceae bacterium]|nr:hypothetical protein [Planctomycetaceae bacterium]